MEDDEHDEAHDTVEPLLRIDTSGRPGSSHNNSSGGGGGGGSTTSPLVIQKITVFESKTRFYIAGGNKTRTRFRLLEIDRTKPSALKVKEHGEEYSYAKCQRAIHELTKKHASDDPVKRRGKICGIMGFVRFSDTYYMVMITKKKKVGVIAGQFIYGIVEHELLPVTSEQYSRGSFTDKLTKVELKYKQLFSSVDVSKDFYFSYRYDLTNTLQCNFDRWSAAGERQQRLKLAMNNTANDPNRSGRMSSTSSTASSSSIIADIKKGVIIEDNGDNGTTTHKVGSDDEDDDDDDDGNSNREDGEAKTKDSTKPPAAEDLSAERLSLLGELAAVRQTLTRRRQISRVSPTDSGNRSRGKAPAFSRAASFSPLTSSFGDHPIHAPQEEATYNEMFLWNYYFVHEFLDVLPGGSHWCVPVIMGYVEQKRVQLGAFDVRITIIARRSRHFAGTRYIKRGVTAEGNVANEVHTEQIVQNCGSWLQGQGGLSSFVLMRGSIPLYWSQENPLAPRPDIKVNLNDEGFKSTQRHFDRVFEQYGSTIHALNLIRMHERHPQETHLGTLFEHSINTVNARLNVENLRRSKLAYEPRHVKYSAYDFLYRKKHGHNVVKELSRMAINMIRDVGFFCRARSPQGPDSVRFTKQNGIVRVNCIDCLDRTNVAQYCIARVALRYQLYALGLTPNNTQDLLPDEILQSPFAEHGDRIAQQYGGSGAMHKEALADGNNDDANGAGGKKKKKRTGGILKNAITSINRYYSNNFTDQEKQRAMNLFLGNYIRSRERPEIWDSDPDTRESHVEMKFNSKTHRFKAPPPVKTLDTKALIDAQLLDRMEKELFHEYINEHYNPSKLTSFDQELEWAWNRAVVVKDAFFYDDRKQVPVVTIARPPATNGNRNLLDDVKTNNNDSASPFRGGSINVNNSNNSSTKPKRRPPPPPGSPRSRNGSAASTPLHRPKSSSFSRPSPLLTAPQSTLPARRGSNIGACATPPPQSDLSASTAFQFQRARTQSKAYAAGSRSANSSPVQSAMALDGGVSADDAVNDLFVEHANGAAPSSIKSSSWALPPPAKFVAPASTVGAQYNSGTTGPHISPMLSHALRSASPGGVVAPQPRRSLAPQQQQQQQQTATKTTTATRTTHSSSDGSFHFINDSSVSPAALITDGGNDVQGEYASLSLGDTLLADAAAGVAPNVDVINQYAEYLNSSNWRSSAHTSTLTQQQQQQLQQDQQQQHVSVPANMMAQILAELQRLRETTESRLSRIDRKLSGR